MNPSANHAGVSCEGKDRLSAGRAHIVAEEMRKRGRKRVQPYHCPHCHHWHVGSNEATEKRRA